MHPFHSYPSTYIGAVLWGCTGFMGQPTFASFIVHFAFVPIVILVMLWLAHWEGARRNPERR